MIKYVLFVLISALTIKYLVDVSNDYISKHHPWIQEVSLMNSSDIIKKHGYVAETHEIKTEDGYLLTVFRIPGKNKQSNKDRIPIILMHGLVSSCIDWIINGPDTALAYYLVDEGYDVWMPNVRGNIYSRKHETLDPEDGKFWQFSFHETGIYDLPAIINFITAKTGHDKMHYVGHSQGATFFFVMASEKPEMNRRILSMQALAPAVFFKYNKIQIYNHLYRNVGIMEKVLNFFGIRESISINEFGKNVSISFCDQESFLYDVCSFLFFLPMGPPSRYFNKSMLPVYMSHIPAGGSFRQFFHFLQMRASEKFRKYDHGKVKNMELYGKEFPPEYDLSRVMAPVSIIYSDGDVFYGEEDVKKLYENLGNPKKLFRVPPEDFHHQDFVWGINAKETYYETMLDFMTNV